MIASAYMSVAARLVHILQIAQIEALALPFLVERIYEFLVKSLCARLNPITLSTRLADDNPTVKVIDVNHPVWC